MKTRIGRIFWEVETKQTVVNCICYTNLAVTEGDTLLIDLHPISETAESERRQEERLKPETRRLYTELGYVLGLDDDFVVAESCFYIDIVRGVNINLVHDAVAAAIIDAFDLQCVETVADICAVLRT